MVLLLDHILLDSSKNLKVLGNFSLLTNLLNTIHLLAEVSAPCFKFDSFNILVLITEPITFFFYTIYQYSILKILVLVEPIDYMLHRPPGGKSSFPMNSRYFITTDSLCSSRVVVPVPPIATEVVEETMDVNVRNMSSARTPFSSFLIRMAIRISRSRCFSFLRRVFHYQNGSRSELGSNPFNSVTCLMMECVALSVQIVITAYTLAISKEERPVWPMRIWVFGYSFGCVLSLILLYWRYWALYVKQRDDSATSDIEHQINHDESRALPPLLERCRTCIELFFAIWFVMGNVWVFDSRFGSFHRSPKLHVLCISLLAWNAITYSFPFILFVLLCCCVPLLSSLLGYNMNMGSVDRGASDEQLSNLPSWKYKEIRNKEEESENAECCICLAKYRDKEEMRQLPCSHIFHLKCVDQWLRIISCCPLCKQELER